MKYVSTSAVRKWGNGYGILIPRKFVLQKDFTEGTVVDIELKNKMLTVRPQKKKPHYTLKEMVRGMSKKGRHPLIDFGPDVGKEIVIW